MKNKYLRGKRKKKDIIKNKKSRIDRASNLKEVKVDSFYLLNSKKKKNKLGRI